MNDSEKRSILALVLMAAFADGAKDDRERAAVRRVAESLGSGADGGPNFWSIYQEVIAKKIDLAQAVAGLTSPEARLLAYEMAVGVCDTDGPPNASEATFLAQLRDALGFSSSATTAPIDREGADVAAAVPASPPPPPLPAAPSNTEPSTRLVAVDAAALDKMVLNYAILNGALELLPQSLASMAILPLQMKMVFRVGKLHGYSLDRGHIRDFLATAGVGLASQAVEGYARKLLGGLVGKALGGGLIGGLARGTTKAATGAAFTFATTWALGQLANRYYAGGRKMETAVLKDTYTRLLADGQQLFTTHAGSIQQRAATLSPSEVINLVREPA
jgi:uncharacterized protein (DUF697 family)/tellurite resistance protein